MKIIKRIYDSIPLKRYIIFESNPDFSDNSYWLFKYMAENTDILKKYKGIWFISNENSARRELCGIAITCVDNYSRRFRSKIKRYYYTFFSHIIIDCNRFIYKRRPNQKRIYLTHGMPLKMPNEYLREIGDCDLLPISAKCFTDFFAQYVKRECINVFGLPRNDVLINKSLALNKYIIWMPTYRQNKNGTNNSIMQMFPLGIPIFKSMNEMDQIDEFLEQKEIKLMLRLHPSQDLSVLNIGNMKNIVIADDEYLKSINETLYSFIASSAALITDYSSVYYDYLLLNRPIGLTLEDVEIFSEKWPLFFDINNELPGTRLSDIYDLKEFITNISMDIDNTRNERESFMERIGVTKTDSCKLITNYISSIMY